MTEEQEKFRKQVMSELREQLSDETYQARPTQQESEAGVFECDACLYKKPLPEGVQFTRGDSYILCGSCWNTLHRLNNHAMAPILEAISFLKNKRTEHLKLHLDTLEAMNE